MWYLLSGFVRSILDGLLIGSVYALMAVGLTLVYRVTQIANFAHAEYITYGAYASYIIMAWFGGGLVEAAVAGMLAGAALSLLSDEAVFKPLWRRGSSSLHLLVASIGVGLIMRYALLAVAASTVGLLKIRLPTFPSAIFYLGNIPITVIHILAPTIAAVSTIVLHLLFTKTKLGKAMRATASNPTLARISGINIFLVRRATWILSGLFAGLSGFIYAYYTQANPESGWIALLWIFSAAIMGGFTFYGTILSGVILGVVGQATMFLAAQLAGVSTAYTPVVALLVMVVVLLFKPEGVIRLQSLSLKRRV